ncbi:6-phosphogluconolactonase [Candidatus Phycosocius spiralis]|nr:6-phosphogluconolactonase [Candidatus Phycosocius spiralis]
MALPFPLFAFESRQEANEALADALAASVMLSHEQGRRARIALSGGSSPEPAYRLFAGMDLDWSHVDIALVDDRWVELSDPGSNQAMLLRAFEAATGVTIFGMKRATKTARESEGMLDPPYASLRPFDAVVLGMGPDGHSASWFPKSPDLQRCLDPKAQATVLGVDASPAPIAAPYFDRMTITLPVVAEAHLVMLLIFGAEKKQILTRALHAPIAIAPIRAAIEAGGNHFVALWAN